MPFSFRTYAVIGITLGLMTFLFSTVFGDNVAQWARDRQIESQLKSQPVLEQLVFRPLELVMATETRVTGAVAVAVVWPIAMMMLFLILIGIVLLSFLDVNEQLTDPLGTLPVIRHWLL
ncbi:MAG: hypothetical protein ACOCXZ_02165 [Chloroflexota bacterium]